MTNGEGFDETMMLGDPYPSAPQPPMMLGHLTALKVGMQTFRNGHSHCDSWSRTKACTVRPECSGQPRASGFKP